MSPDLWPLGPEDEAAAVACAPRPARVLCRDGAGERALAWALTGAEQVQVCGDTAGQAVLALKLGVGELLWEEALQVLGLLADGRRVFLYHRMRQALPDWARAFWDAQEAQIRLGVLKAGPVERALHRWRRGMHGLGALKRPELLAGVRARALSALLTQGSPLPRDLSLRVATTLRAGPTDNPFLEWALTGSFADPGRARISLSQSAHAALSTLAPRLSLGTSLEQALQGTSRWDLIDLGRCEDPALWIPRAAPRLAPEGRLLWWGPALPAAPGPGLRLEPPSAVPDRSPLVGPLRCVRATG